MYIIVSVAVVSANFTGCKSIPHLYKKGMIVRALINKMSTKESQADQILDLVESGEMILLLSSMSCLSKKSL